MSKIGIICRIERDRYYILTQEGDFLLRSGAPPAGKSLGDKVLLASAKGMWLRGLAITAALVLAIVSAIHLTPGAPEPATYALALDINPSLEFDYNEDYGLLGWTAFNERGRDVLAGLEMPQDLYAALHSVFLRCLELELVRDEQDIFVTAAEAPLDNDRLLGAFEAQGAKVKLHVVRLAEAEYSSQAGSPLRSYLNRKEGIDLSDSTPVAETALLSLNQELTASLEVMPWHNNPIVQAFVEEYLVRGELVEDMLDSGLGEDEIASLLKAAQAEKLTPADIFKAFKNSGLSPGQFLKEHKAQNNAQGPKMSGPAWLADFLAQEFNHPAGQLSSTLNKGLEPTNLQAILILEEMGAGKLQPLIRNCKATDVQGMLAEFEVDAQEFEERFQRLQGLVDVAKHWSEAEAVASLSAEYKVPRGQVLYILAQGYDVDEADRILQQKPKSLKEYLDGFGANQGEEPKGNQGNGNQGKGNPGKGNKDKGTPPGQSMGNDRPPGQDN